MAVASRPEKHTVRWLGSSVCAMTGWITKIFQAAAARANCLWTVKEETQNSNFALWDSGTAVPRPAHLYISLMEGNVWITDYQMSFTRPCWSELCAHAPFLLTGRCAYVGCYYNKRKDIQRRPSSNGALQEHKLLPDVNREISEHCWVYSENVSLTFKPLVSSCWAAHSKDEPFCVSPCIFASFSSVIVNTGALEWRCPDHIRSAKLRVVRKMMFLEAITALSLEAENKKKETKVDVQIGRNKLLCGLETVFVLQSW